MKRVIRSNRHFRILCMTLAIFLLLPFVFMLPAAAEQSFREWNLSEDGTVLQSGSDLYTLFGLPTGYYLDIHSRYQFYLHVYLPDKDIGGDLTVNASQKNADLVWLEGILSDENPVYVNEDGKAALNRFIGGEATTFRLKTGNGTPGIGNDLSLFEKYPPELSTDTIMECILPASLRSELENARAVGMQKEVNVSDLRNVTRFDITAYDETDSIACVYGAIYQLSDEKYYYLNYTTLGNQYFDAEGNFSYRSGSVKLTELDETLQVKVGAAVERMEERTVSFDYEDNVPDSYDEDTRVFGLRFALVFFGLLVPIAPFVIGLILPRSQKRGYPKYWYLVSLVAALCMLLTILLLILIAVA